MLTRTRLPLAVGLLIALVAGSPASGLGATSTASSWAVYDTLSGPAGATHLEGAPGNVTDGDASTTYVVVQDQPLPPASGPSITVKLRAAGGFGDLRPVKEIRVTVHVGTPLQISLFGASAYGGIGGGPQPAQLIKQWIINASTVPPGTTVAAGQVFSWSSPTPVMMDDVYVVFSASSFNGTTLNNPIGFAEIEVVEDTAPAVQVQVSPAALTTNSEGWYADNPVEVQVTLSCPAGGAECVSPLLVHLYAATAQPARFYVYAASLRGDASLPRPCEESEDDASTPYSARDYSMTCAELRVPPGGSLSRSFWLWVQPSAESTLVASADWLPFGRDSKTVTVPAAHIHPVVFVPGILGTMPPSYNQSTGQMDPTLDTYTPLLVNLQKMGYELYDPSQPLRPATLFPLPYDWRQSNDRSADDLAITIPQVLALANQLPYVGEAASGQFVTRTDIVVHSMGGLVTRAYVQGARYANDVRRVVFIASPHRGFPVTYKTLEGLSWWDYLHEPTQFDLRVFMDGFIWPNLIWKKYNPSLSERLQDNCTNPFDCPALARWSHDAERGIESLPQMLPTNDVPDYLFCPDRPLVPVGCTPGQANPRGRPANDWLSALNAAVPTLTDRLGADNILVIYGSGSETDVSYGVGFPGPRDTWRNGEVIEIGRAPSGDDLIPDYSTNLKLLLPQIPDANVKRLEGAEARHKEIMFHPAVQQQFVPAFLTGEPVLFVTPYLTDPIPAEGLPLIIGVGCPVNLTVTDPQGRRVGFDPDGGGTLAEIPGARYAAPNTEGQFVILPDAPAGSYRLTLTAFGDGEFTLYVNRLAAGRLVPFRTFTGKATAGETVEFDLDYTRAIFEDQFDRPDSTDLGPAWEETAGDWSIVNGRLHTATSGDPCPGERPCPLREGDDDAREEHGAATAFRPSPLPPPIPQRPFRKETLTRGSFEAPAFTLEARLRLAQRWRWPVAQGLFPIPWRGVFGAELSFGRAPDGAGGYRVVLDSWDRILLLRADGRLLGAGAARAKSRNAWRQVKVARGEDNLMEVWVDEGGGYPKEPHIRAMDDAYPRLGRLGLGLSGMGSAIDVDWIVARPR